MEGNRHYHHTEAQRFWLCMMRMIISTALTRLLLTIPPSITSLVAVVIIASLLSSPLSQPARGVQMSIHHDRDLLQTTTHIWSVIIRRNERLLVRVRRRRK